MFYAEPRLRIELEMVPRYELEYLLDGIPHQLHGEDLLARYVLFGPHDEHLNSPSDLPVCLIDTGAQLSLIPQRFWEPHDQAGRIVWLTTGIDGRLIKGIGGAKTRTRLGRVEFWLLDTKNRRRLRQWIIAECAYDRDDGPEELPHALFGLGGEAMKDSGLCINYADRHAWFVRAC